jgi:hypothetical protein
MCGIWYLVSIIASFSFSTCSDFFSIVPAFYFPISLPTALRSWRVEAGWVNPSTALAPNFFSLFFRPASDTMLWA